MNNIKDKNINTYTYELPECKIAKFPKDKRDTSKLLFYKNGQISEHQFSDITELISDNKLLVYNNTKVIQARLHFFKPTGAKIEIFCLEPHNPQNFEQNFKQTSTCEWKCMTGNLKKWKSGLLTHNYTIDDNKYSINAEKIEVKDNHQIIRFSWNSKHSFSHILETIGHTPIPPYINRKTEKSDKQNYQTVYSEKKGSVAAPTAGLHFTDELLHKLSKQNIKIGKITLHVGAGTFKPVQTATIGEHEMHSEHFFVTKSLINELLNNEGKIVAVGTTSVRTLESLYWLGVQLINEQIPVDDNIFFVKQWEPYQEKSNIPPKNALNAILKHIENSNYDYIEGHTQIIIVPGYNFRYVNELITNFHMPQSTLLLLISAFIGNDWREVYDYALKHDFRFLSYGDSSYLRPKNKIL